VLQRSDQLSARCGVGTASLQLLRHVSAARSGSAAAGACRPGAGEPLSPPSTGVGPSPPMGLARARCGFHPHPTLPALTASGNLRKGLTVLPRSTQLWSRAPLSAASRQAPSLAKASERGCPLTCARIRGSSARAWKRERARNRGRRPGGERLQYDEDGARHCADVRKLHPWTARAGRAGS
jgi:hypothetical protein